MRWTSGGIACWLLLALTTAAGEKKDEGPVPERDIFVKLVNQLSAGLTRDRVEAIDTLSRQTNPDLIREFEVVAKLTAIAEDRNKTASPLERAAAVRGLATLYSKNLGRQDTIETLVKMVEDSKTDVRVRLDVLRLLADMGQHQDRITAIAFNALKKMWENRTRLTPPLPPLVQKALIECLGGFYKQEGVKPLLVDAFTKEKSAAVRLGALCGLRRCLENSFADSDAKLLPQFLANLQNTKDQDIRLEIIRVVEIILRNLPAENRSAQLGGTKSLLKGILEESENDDEVQMAVQLLLRMVDADVTAAILKAAKPRPGTTLSVTTYRMLSDALGEVLLQLRPTAKREDTKQTVVAIRGHFLWLLDPRNNIPSDFRRSAVFAFKMWPIEFDRTDIVQALVALLTVEKDASLATEIEDALLWITGQRFRKRDVEKRQDLPDIDSWNKWIENNKGLLAPDKDPHETLDRGL